MSSQLVGVDLPKPLLGAVCDWIGAAVEARPLALGHVPGLELLAALRKASRRKGLKVPTIKRPRAEWEAFVVYWRRVLFAVDPELLLDDGRAGRRDHWRALADVVVAADEALCRGRGRPRAIDPLAAVEAYYDAAVTYSRAPRRHRNVPPTLAGVAASLGIGKTALALAVNEGQDLLRAIDVLRARLPRGSEPFLVCADYEQRAAVVAFDHGNVT